MKQTILFLCLLTGCQSSKILLNNTFWDQKNLKIGVVLCDLTPKATMWAEDDIGTITISQSSEVKDFLKFIKLFADSNTKKISESSAQALLQKGHQVIFLPKSIQLVETLDLRDKSDRDVFEKMTLKQNVDFILLYKIEFIGVGVMSQEQAMFLIKGELYDVKNKVIIWRDRVEQTQGVPLELPWRQPPNFPNLAVGLRKAIDQSKDDLLKSLFESHQLTK